MIYDAKKQELLPGTVKSVCGVKGFISWGRLIDELRTSGEVRRFEEVTHLEIGDAGIHIVVSSTKKQEV
jgi:hypothetical protein